MDFIRASIKALYYDFPVDTAIQIVTTGSPTLTGEFPKLVNARERCYTKASVDALTAKLRNEWMGGGLLRDGIDEMLMALQVPWRYAAKVMDDSTSDPVVVFHHLFRWTELTRYVGETLITISWLAKRDVDSGTTRTDFIWDSVLPHNNTNLNKALREDGQGWCDIHQHLWASTDVFALNWLSLMNHIQGRKDDFAKLIHPLDSPVIVTKSYNYENLYRWCVLAAMIRWELYRYYIESRADAFGEVFEREFARIACQVPMYFRYELRDLQCLINEAGRNALHNSDNKVIDYAIREEHASATAIQSPFMLYHGERYLLYQYYRDYWSHQEGSRRIGKYVYLYELVKNQLRRELTQVNDLPGLGNFQAYNKRKTELLEKGMGRTAKRFAVQTTLTEPTDGMEARIPPQPDRKGYRYLLQMDYHKHLFGGGTFTTEADLKDRMTFVVHFMKRPCTNNRYAEQREMYRQQAEVLMEKVWLKTQASGQAQRIVGIDVAGGETNSRPEVFAHLYRYCRACGMKNFTYHVGEDFYDITDGLRSIDEAVWLLNLEKGNRLGHCIALGIDAKRYYAKRHRVVIMPKQILLDNLVWLIEFARHHHIGLLDIHQTLEQQIEMLYAEIGYELPYNMTTYRRSMLLRGNDMEKYETQNSKWLSTARDMSVEAVAARQDSDACRLCQQYFADPDIYRNGFLQSATFKAPYLYERLIKKVQNTMMRQIIDKGISIETNPTSNVRIGQLVEYDKLPLFRFSKVKGRQRRHIAVTANTDDKGIFCTSLHREYSLLALALSKQRHKGEIPKWNWQMICKYVGEIASSGQLYRFK